MCGSTLWYAELHRLQGVFLAVLGADGTQIEASFCQAIRTAREQKSISVAKCAQKKATKNTAANRQKYGWGARTDYLFGDKPDLGVRLTAWRILRDSPVLLKLDCDRFQLGERFDSYLAKFTAPAGFLESSPRQVGIENIRAVHPHGTGIDCLRQAQRFGNIARPDAGCQTVSGLIRDRGNFVGIVERNRAYTHPHKKASGLSVLKFPFRRSVAQMEQNNINKKGS